MSGTSLWAFYYSSSQFTKFMRIRMSTNEIPAPLLEFSQRFTQIADSGYSIKRNEGVGVIKLNNSKYCKPCCLPLSGFI